MSHTFQPAKTVSRLGFWSAGLTTALTALFFVALAIPSENLMFASSFLLAPVFVTMMVSVHHSVAAERRVWSQLGVSFTIIYAVLCSSTYYVQLTFVQNNYLPVAEAATLPFVFVPGTPTFALDMLGYAFMCAATLAAAPVFAGSGLERWIKRLFIFNGVLFILPTLAIPVIPMSINEAGTGTGDLVGRYANMVWTAYFATATTLVTALFRRSN